MIYLIEIFKGIMLAFGVIAGFTIFLFYIIHRVSKEEQYDANDLVDGFKQYYEKICDEENYEEIEIVKNIISELDKGVISKDVSDFKIKKQSSLQIMDEYGKTSITVNHKYIVLNKIENIII